MGRQVADLIELLLIAKKMAGAPNRVIFDDEGSYILDKSTGEWMAMKDDGKMYTLKLWVCREGDEDKDFTWQA